MQLTGHMLIGAQDIPGSQASIHAINPANNQTLQPAYPGGSQADVDHACQLAQAAFTVYRQQPIEARARLLEAIATEIEALGDTLLERAHLETGLPLPRLAGERGRTTGQLRLFAHEIRAGYWLDARIDPAQPNRQPLPRSDLRLQYIPLGPVAVFGASNFPLAFSVAGGDTAAALAAGCPVIVKGHSAHPGTSELTARAVCRAIQACGLPEGIFALLFGSGAEVGQALARHPNIKAVAFTGSRAGGVALMHTAANRPEPIPVFAEMSSINPVFLLPGALSQRAESLAQGFVQSLTLGAGQFCTNPGLVIATRSPGLDAFCTAATRQIQDCPSTTMLTPGIHRAYQEGLSRLEQHPKVVRLGQGHQADDAHNACRPTLLKTDAASFIAAPHELGNEVFGAAALLVECEHEVQVTDIIDQLEGQLTATLHMDAAYDTSLARTLVAALEPKVGRILFNGYPTGVEVCNAMVHGGPFPATSDPRSTSVGTAAIHRFLRPICYQDMPPALLPDTLQPGNPLGIPRRESPAQ